MIRFTVADLPDQKFSVILAGRRVSMRLRYNVSFDFWAFDLAIDDAPVLYGRRIVTGVDLIAPFNFGIGSIFAYGVRADRKTLVNGQVVMYHATQAEIDAALVA